MCKSSSFPLLGRMILRHLLHGSSELSLVSCRPNTRSRDLLICTFGWTLSPLSHPPPLPSSPLLLLGLTTWDKLPVLQSCLSPALLLGANLRLRHMALIRAGWVLFPWCVLLNYYHDTCFTLFNSFPLFWGKRCHISRGGRGFQNQVLPALLASSPSLPAHFFSALALLSFV